ncbi:hypothetical protein DPEC_G00104680 [Dallia pectoralis]|uniref:Uncharacterized protein n=1 Tax=Dallia pectoralis TaxID=75939 RepID=A0ACC2GXI3_DALPE|nr:hypothetical protein DPEC_G00104680 [Dallia pectoralis]
MTLKPTTGTSFWGRLPNAVGGSISGWGLVERCGWSPQMLLLALTRVVSWRGLLWRPHTETGERRLYHTQANIGERLGVSFLLFYSTLPSFRAPSWNEPSFVPLSPREGVWHRLAALAQVQDTCGGCSS